MASRYPELVGRSPSRGTVANARKRLPLVLWQNLFQHVSHTAQAWGETFAYWRGHRVVLLDGTCVSMADEPALCEAFGANTGCHGPGRYPLARVASLCLAGTMTVTAYALGGYRDSEWTLAGSILAVLRKGDLLVADRHLAAAHYYWRYQLLGLESLTRARQRLIVSRIKRVQSYRPNDFLGWPTINKQYRKKDRALPERPGRIEPRAVRREHKHYPALRETRTEWRKRHAA